MKVRHQSILGIVGVTAQENECLFTLAGALAAGDGAVGAQAPDRRGRRTREAAGAPLNKRLWVFFHSLPDLLTAMH